MAPPNWFDGAKNIVTLAFILGVISAALADTGQPAALTRFMALRDPHALSRARWLALLGVAGLAASSLILGWCSRDVLPQVEGGKLLFPVLAGILLPAGAAVLIAVVVAAYLVLGVGSACLSLVSAWVVDLRRPKAGSATRSGCSRGAPSGITRQHCMTCN